MRTRSVKPLVDEVHCHVESVRTVHIDTALPAARCSKKCFFNREFHIWGNHTKWVSCDRKGGMGSSRESVPMSCHGRVISSESASLGTMPMRSLDAQARNITVSVLRCGEARQLPSQ